MVLLPPQCDNNNDGRQLARWRRTRRRLLPVAEEQHPGLPRHPPRRMRRRRGNRGQAGGGTSSAVSPERVDDAGTPAGDMSGVVLAPETTTGVVSPQCANPKRTDDASTLAKDLLDVNLVPEMTMPSVPDATSPPSIDQEVPSVFHPVPFRFSFDPPSDPASVSAFVKAYPYLSGYHMWSTWDRLTTVSTYGPPGSEEEDGPDSGWDFSGLSNPSAMRDFMTACDYCLSGCSDDGHSLDNKGCGPSHDCFHVDLGGHDKGNHLGMPEDDDPPGPGPRVDILRELAVVPVPAGGQDTQLEQIREMQAKLDEEAGQLVQLLQNIEQEWAGQALAGEACHRAQDVQRRIVDDARARLPPASSGVGQNLAASAMLLRAMPEPSTTEGQRIQGELKNLLEDAAVRWAESSAYRRQGCPPEHHATTSRLMREVSVRTGHTRDGTPAAPDRLDDEHHRGDRRARLDERVHRGYHPRRGGGSEPLAQTTRSASLQPGHTTGAVPDPVPGPDYHHQVLGGNKAGVVACGLQAGMPAGRNGRRQPHHPKPPPVPLRRRPGLAGASASCTDLQLGRPSQGLRWKFPGHVRAPWELMGSPKLPPAARGIPTRVHPTVFEAAHRAAQHHRFGCHRGVPRRHHLPRPSEQTGAPDSHQGE
jgi:hypothetical protein